eukprot:ANDGO_02855.mRNA.1 WD repeat-containing protein 59 homolog
MFPFKCSLRDVSVDASQHHLVVTSSDGLSVYFTIDSQLELQRNILGHAFRSAQFSPHASNVSQFASLTSQYLELWDIHVEEPLRTFDHSAHSVEWSPFDPNVVLTGCGKLWDWRKREPLSALSVSSWATTFGSSSLSCLTFNKINPYLIAGVCGNDVRVWDTRNLSTLYILAPHSKPVLSIDWSSVNQNLLVSSSADGRVKVWDVRDGEKPLTTTVSSEMNPVNAVKFAPFGIGYLFSCRNNLCLYGLRDIREPVLAAEFVGHTRSVKGFSFLSDERFVSFSEDNSLRFWTVDPVAVEACGNTKVEFTRGRKVPFSRTEVSRALPAENSVEADRPRPVQNVQLPPSVLDTFVSKPDMSLISDESVLSFLRSLDGVVFLEQYYMGTIAQPAQREVVFQLSIFPFVFRFEMSFVAGQLLGVVYIRFLSVSPPVLNAGLLSSMLSLDCHYSQDTISPFSRLRAFVSALFVSLHRDVPPSLSNQDLEPPLEMSSSESIHSTEPVLEANDSSRLSAHQSGDHLVPSPRLFGLSFWSGTSTFVRFENPSSALLQQSRSFAEYQSIRSEEVRHALELSRTLQLDAQSSKALDIEQYFSNVFAFASSSTTTPSSHLAGLGSSDTKKMTGTSGKTLLGSSLSIRPPASSDVSVSGSKILLGSSNVGLDTNLLCRLYSIQGLPSDVALLNLKVASDCFGNSQCAAIATWEFATRLCHGMDCSFDVKFGYSHPFIEGMVMHIFGRLIAERDFISVSFFLCWIIQQPRLRMIVERSQDYSFYSDVVSRFCDLLCGLQLWTKYAEVMKIMSLYDDVLSRRVRTTTEAIVCSVCHRRARGLVCVCPCCGHGGHLSHVLEWFKCVDDRLLISCPWPGCGCECHRHTDSWMQEDTSNFRNPFKMQSVLFGHNQNDAFQM